MRAYLTKAGLWNDKMESDTNDEQRKTIDKEVEIAEAFKPDPKSMFQNLYSFIPDSLNEELEDAEANNFWQGVI